MCGGTIRCPTPIVSCGGLSPRVRGNPLRQLNSVYDERSIPACAGEPRASLCPRTTREVYPRVCGGTSCSRPKISGIRGLSPRVRGNLDVGDSRDAGGGSIPACAGEPLRLSPAPGVARVYPRVCGGTTALTRKVYSVPGLSPRVRGNLARCPLRRGDGRSIPACAGEPPLGTRGAFGQPVYPRVCGGTGYPRHDIPPHTGLSPRVRGNHL